MKQFIFYLVDGRCLFPVESTYLNLEVVVLIFCPGLNAHSTFVLCFCVVLNCKQEVADGDPGSHCTDTSTITTRPRYQAPPPTAVCSIRSYTVVQIKIPNQKPGYTVCLCLQGVPYHWAHFLFAIFSGSGARTEELFIAIG